MPIDDKALKESRRRGAENSNRGNNMLDSYERRVDIRSALIEEDLMRSRMGRPSARLREVG